MGAVLDHPNLPANYSTPEFPSLYWPLRVLPGEPQYLYYIKDIWRFTFLWTIIMFGGFHLAASTYAVLMQVLDMRHLKGRRGSWFVWLAPFLYVIIAGVEAVLAGTVVGLIVGAVYTAGYFKMSTWVPFLWALISVLVLILSSFSIQGGL